MLGLPILGLGSQTAYSQMRPRLVSSYVFYFGSVRYSSGVLQTVQSRLTSSAADQRLYSCGSLIQFAPIVRRASKLIENTPPVFS